MLSPRAISVHEIAYSCQSETAVKEVGVWGFPPALEVPQDWGIRGLIEIIPAVLLRVDWVHGLC